MAETLEIFGISASPGVGVGPVHLAAEFTAEAPAPGDTVAAEGDKLRRAVTTAVAELEALAYRSDEESAGILDFQIEMLLDPALVEMAEERMLAGDGAALAWFGALDDYIAGIEAAPDEQLGARAVDIVDIRNRVLSALTGRPLEDFAPGSVFVGKDLEPSLFLAHDWTTGGGIVLFEGSVSSHVAMLARSRSVPMLVATGRFEIAPGARVLVDGNDGRAVIAPDDEHVREAKSRKPAARPTASRAGGAIETADGVAIRLSAIINDPLELRAVDPASFAGIGLMRTEFLVTSPADAVDEEKHYDIYRHALDWAGESPAIVRMLDLGGDKTLPGARRSESFMGLRGIRLLLARPKLARAQARALLRAAVHGNLGVLLPMVTVPDELEAMRAIFEEESTALGRRGVQTRMPEIGMMVEVPVAGLMLDRFSRSDFFSFGTNDLAQYLAAAARDDQSVAALYDAATPAVLRVIAQGVALAEAMKKPIGICGEMASDPRHIPALMAAGLRHFSVAPNRLADIRTIIGGMCSDGRAAAEMK
ncbi:MULTISPECIES: putative PEP-binding protein [Sinorhizobium]|uniref:Phosphoenolpyruvate protein kinase n=1 Tax=Sinorhizobium americanum TaxID=194963 RepID=A0A2S3YR18_9HYPH|nr:MULTISPECIES: putative PEP-binding protein [Sinorhizobium]PDT35551.1 phosphoenolpyruvate protein kinase [Sinorhizobium sp. FG01]PDT49083.1 phosphoenolpyruvate protein kinase [Sinorhizobium sp. NG07B]POH33232.1 phosphoenolpyruvate protein kinase [Sinorhizobium americanum]POH33846.1 phosphoenolpyruvate protein kinase [Sinorhizobium americanum]